MLKFIGMPSQHAKQFIGMPSQHAKQLWDGGTDALGNLPERAISDGKGNPCRHCLKMIEAGKNI